MATRSSHRVGLVLAALHLLAGCTLQQEANEGPTPADPGARAIAPDTREQASRGAQTDIPMPVVAAVRGLRHRFHAEAGSIAAGSAELQVQVAEDGAFSLAPAARASAASDQATAPATMTVATSRIERSGGEPAPLASTTRVDGDGRVVIERGVTTEMLTKTEHGVQQSWRFVRPPEGDGALHLQVDISGYDYLERDEQGLRFEDPGSGLVMRYGLAYWIDAEGVTTEIAPSFDRGRIAIEVPAELVDASAYPVILDPEIGPEFPVDEGISSFTVERAPDIAYDSVTGNYFAAWYNGVRIEGIRLAADGTPLEAGPVLLHQLGSTDPLTVRVAAANGTFLVAYRRFNVTQFEQAAVLVNASTGLAGAPFRALNSGLGAIHDGDVASNGSEFMIVARRADNVLMSERISTAGVRLGAAEVLPNQGSAPEQIALGYGDGRYLMVWRRQVSGVYQVFARRLVASGIPFSEVRQLSQNTSGVHGSSPSVTWDGTKYFVAWERSGSAPGQIHGNRMESQGNGLVEAFGGYTLVFGCTAGATTCPVTHHAPSLALDPSGGARLSWRVAGTGEGYLPGIYSSRVTAAGLTGTLASLSGQQTTALETHVACGTTGCPSVWRDQRTFNFDVYTARSNLAGGAEHAPGLRLAIGVYAENSPDVAFDGTNYAVVYPMRDSANDDHVYLSRVSPAGEILDAAPILLSSPLSRIASTPRISFGGGVYFVSWSIINNVHYARVTPAGVVLDPGGVVLSALPSGQSRLDADNAFDGSGFLVVYRERTLTSPSTFGVSAARVPVSGAAGPAFNLRPFDTTVTLGGVDCVGPDCLAVYGDAAAGAAVLVSASNQVGAPVALASAGVALAPSLSASPSGYLVAWNQPNGALSDIMARRFSTAGVSGSEIAIATAAELAASTSVVFDGSKYLVAWHQESSNDRSLDVYGAGVPTNSGGTTDPGGFGIATLTLENFSSVDETLPRAAAGLDGQILVAYRRNDPNPGFANVNRVRARFVVQETPDTTPPTIDFTPENLVVEGEGPLGALVTYTTPTASDDVDGVAPVDCLPPSGNVFPFGDTVVTCTATDNAGNSAGVTFTVTVQDTTPPMCEVAASTSFECTGPSGIGGSDVAVQAHLATLEAHDLCSEVDVSHDLPATLATACGGAITTVRFSVLDASGNEASCATAITVSDTTAPSLDCPAPIAVECNTAGGVAGDDPQLTAWIADAAAVDLCNAVGIASDLPALLSRGTTAVQLTATDTCTNTSACETSVTVVDTAPAVLSALSVAAVPVPVGTHVSAGASFTAACGPHTGSFAWGDGATSAASLSEGAGTASGSHVYTAAGVYTLTLTVTDAAGNAANVESQYVVVYDPSAGFVTGGGFIQSPAGAYTSDPSLTGKAHFGFVAKYVKGANTPTGNTNFRFQAGDLDFVSTSYDWLVVAGAAARYKGVGSLDGVGGHQFMLTATDGQRPGGGGVDRFRMKITAPGGALVYDNQLGAGEDAAASQVIAGGSIQIHQ
jgi:hypothetical protein